MAANGPKALVAGNWKMNGSVAMLKEPRLLAAMLKDVKLKCDVMVCPPAILARRVKAIVKGSKIRVGGQDCHGDASGAHTGDISAEMLKEAGCSAVIVGHSERRTNHGETDAVVAKKAMGAMRAGLTAIVCIGETLDEKEGRQDARRGFPSTQGVDPRGRHGGKHGRCLRAGVGDRHGAHTHHGRSRRVHAHIRGELAKITGEEGAKVRILYGGSVKPSNAVELMSVANVNGALVGGASPKAADFIGIIKAYA